MATRDVGGDTCGARKNKSGPQRANSETNRERRDVRQALAGWVWGWRPGALGHGGSLLGGLKRRGERALGGLQQIHQALADVGHVMPLALDQPLADTQVRINPVRPFNTMRREEVADNLTNQAFEFFYWFSRFEFALKENGYLKSHSAGSKAEPGWDEFVVRWQDLYVVSPEATELLAMPPEAQIVLANDQLAWRPVGLSDCNFDLAKVVRLVKTVRNNLFHGGKHGGASWDNPQRTASLLSIGKSILDQLARLASLEADYRQYY